MTIYALANESLQEIIQFFTHINNITKSGFSGADEFFSGDENISYFIKPTRKKLQLLKYASKSATFAQGNPIAGYVMKLPV